MKKKDKKKSRPFFPPAQEKALSEFRRRVRAGKIPSEKEVKEAVFACPPHRRRAFQAEISTIFLARILGEPLPSGEAMERAMKRVLEKGRDFLEAWKRRRRFRVVKKKSPRKK